MSQTLQYCQRSYFENTLIVRKAAECNLWELLIIVNLFRALKQQHVGLNGKRQHEGEITAIKLALKTVCLSLERLIFSDPYQFNEIKHYPSSHKFPKCISQEE